VPQYQPWSLTGLRPNFTSHNMEVHNDEKRDEQKSQAVAVVGDAPSDVETAQVVDEKYYSKVSVYLMMLFSGLAMGSDG
jgi:hypothetical protein